MNDSQIETLEQLNQKGITLIQLAAAWALRLKRVTCVLIGAKNIKQVEGYLGVVGFKLGDMVTIEGGYGEVSHDSDVVGEKDE